jgi:hypothetical protein
LQWLLVMRVDGLVLGVFMVSCVSEPQLGSQTGSIVGGEYSQPGTLPWIVGMNLGEEENIRCTGTLIGDDVVLTAAHCTSDIVLYVSFGLAVWESLGWSEEQKLAQLDEIFAATPSQGELAGRVFIGATNLEAADSSQTRMAVRYELHPNFLPELKADAVAYVEAQANGEATDIRLGYDFSVVHLSAPVSTPTALLAQPGQVAEVGATAAGYGAIDVTGETVEHRLKQMDANIIDVECADDTTCAPGLELRIAGSQPGSQICFGDSGGPLLVGNVVVGVASRLDGNAPDDVICAGLYPQIYGRVDAVSEWLAPFQTTAEPEAEPEKKTEMVEDDDAAPAADQTGGCRAATGSGQLALGLILALASLKRRRRRCRHVAS